MKVFTPGSVAAHAGSKYLGVLVAAKYARSLNELRRGQMMGEPEPGAEMQEKLTTIALGEVAGGELDFEMVDRRRNEI
jgi:DNA-directed RNA polymerase omega subunit